MSDMPIDSFKLDDTTQSVALDGAVQRPAIRDIWGRELGTVRLANCHSSDHGPIERITFPAGWCQYATAYSGVGLRRCETFGPAENKTASISVFYSGLPVSERGAHAFSGVLAAKPAINCVEEVGPRQIRLLSEAMGKWHVGSNQHTNVLKNRKPAFYMSGAFTRRVNNKTVLAVEGMFVDESGNSIESFSGVFASADSEPQRIEQVFLLTAPGQLHKYSKEFQQTLDSIRWKQ